MGTFIMISQLILALSILVTIHEWGHYYSAKKFGMKVEKFYLFFDPWFSVIKKKIGETEYGIGWIPLGGYVKISGMIDESMDKEQMAKPAEPWEFRSKPAWQRLIVMLGGIIMNVVTGIIVFIGITWYYGDSYIAVDKMKNGIYAYEYGQAIGFETGDKLLEVNGNKIVEFKQALSPDVLLGDNVTFKVLRNEQEKTIILPEDFINNLSKDKQNFIGPQFGFTVGDIQKNSNAETGGLLKGDIITKVNETSINSFQQFDELKKQNTSKELAVQVNRKNAIANLKLTVGDDGVLGFQVVPEDISDHKTFTFSEAIPIGTKKAFSVVTANVKGFGKMFTGKVDPTKSLSGPIAIAKMFGETWNWEKFWGLVGLLSMVLAFMNLLPIPALDGGHVVFLLYEIIIGKAPNEKFMEYAQTVGMVLLLGLMIFAFGNDIYNW